ncbi:MAG: sel1 repeat family protein, partial [Alphaproteobacteria bacterium]|nr:sel1 repeat family protein [Alphaproteobacteria bacterium]
MLFSRTARSLTCFLLLSTSAYATLSVSGNHIPLEPEEDLAKTPVCQATRESNFQQAREWEEEGTSESYKKAAEAYKKAGVSGLPEAFIHLGYLYEKRLLGNVETIEERRLMDALAAYYIEKGGNAQIEGHSVHFHFLEELEEDEDQQPPFVSLATIQEDENLTDAEKFFKIGEWYEQQRKPGETIAQKRLRYAYAGRYYEEAALWHFYPKAYTSLGHMYYFGKGIDISDMPLSARLQAQMYYEGGVFSEYVDQPDAESRFMLGFLSEQEQTPESAKSANSHYQAAADQDYSPAAFRLGVRYEQGQEDEIDVPTYYKKAEAYYAKALNAPKPPAFISLLIAMPDDLANKVTLAKKLQNNSEGLDTPTYGLIDMMFCEYLRTNLAQSIMPYWIDLSLARYAHDHGLSYKKDPSKTVERVKGIAGELRGTRADQIIPDLTAHEQKFFNFENSKNMPQSEQIQGMRLMIIMQRLGQEDNKWKEIPGVGMKSHVEFWLQEAQPLVKGINVLPEPFEGDPFLAALTTRMKGLPTANHTLDPSIDLFPQGYLDSLGQELIRIKKEAQMIFGVLKPYQRSLSQQHIIYKNLQEIKRHIGKPSSFELLQDILLARTLMMESSKDEDQSEKIVKHFQSACALRSYAASHNLSIDQAKTELGQKARQFLPLLSPQLHDFSIIGYDVIITLLQDTPSQGIWEKASQDYRKKLLFALNQGGLDNSWINADDFDLAYLSGSSNPTKNALTKLYSKAKSYVVGEEPLFSHEKPILKLSAVTYEDPHIGLYGNIVSDTFKDLQAEAHQLYEDKILGQMSEQTIYQSLLDREILKIRNIIDSMNLPEVDIGEFDQITGIIESAQINLLEKADRKQNLLFMLKKSADWKNPEIEPIALAAQGTINGTEGRCPDGQATFFQD